MKITGVEAIPLVIPFSYGVDLGRGNVKQLDFCLVKVQTDEGLVGWGEAFAYNCRSAVAAAVKDMIAPLALGHDASDIAALNQFIQKKLHIFGRFGITAFALSGLDIALWDIAGKAAGVPLHQLLGATRSSSIPCYASLLRYADTALVARYCDRALSEGHTAIKLHEVTVEAVAAARARAGAEVPLMLDVNCEWSREVALDMARRLRPHALHWLEEPVFPPEDFHALRTVGEASGIAIACGENLCFASQFEALRETGAVAFAQPSVTKVGGITEFLKVVDSGVRIAPHSPYFGPGALATLHLIAAKVPEARFEYYYLWPEAMLYPGLFGGAHVAIPDAHGVGPVPDPGVIGRYRV
jgi:D-galactarolactone cycloisomerase